MDILSQSLLMDILILSSPRCANGCLGSPIHRNRTSVHCYNSHKLATVVVARR
ncbi:hypothetical protein Hanom_Chr12g01109931 [Helianthus anomalus]